MLLKDGVVKRNRVDVPCPRIVYIYNKKMGGGVDLADMLISLYFVKLQRLLSMPVKPQKNQRVVDNLRGNYRNAHQLLIRDLAIHCQ